MPVGERGPRVGESDFPVGESDFPVGKSDFPAGKSDFPVGKSDLRVSESDFPAGKSDLRVSKSGFPVGKFDLRVVVTCSRAGGTRPRPAGCSSAAPAYAPSCSSTAGAALRRVDLWVYVGRRASRRSVSRENRPEKESEATPSDLWRLGRRPIESVYEGEEAQRPAGTRGRLSSILPTKR